MDSPTSAGVPNRPAATVLALRPRHRGGDVLMVGPEGASTVLAGDQQGSG